MEEQFRKDPVVPNEESTIILGIYAHGSDLCNTRLSEHHEKTLVFSMANKGCVYKDKQEKQYVKVMHLATELNQNKRNIFDVFNDFENKCRTPTDTNFNLYDKPEYDTLIKYDDLYIDNINLNMQAEKSFQDSSLKENQESSLEKDLKEKKEKEIIEEYNKNIRIYKAKKQKILENKELYTKFIESCEKNYAAKPRHVKIDRIYDINQGGPYSIYVLDIRRPKTEDQNNFEQIVARLNEKKEITLSELLRICYDELHFDYVSIIDFACRCNDDGTCDVDCPSSINELKEGQELMGMYQSKNLGGKIKKKRTKRMRKSKRMHKSKRTRK